MQESLDCSNKMRLVVTYALLRRPLVDNLKILLRFVYDDNFYDDFIKRNDYDPAHLNDDTLREYLDKTDSIRIANIEKVFVPESLVEDYEEQLDLPEEVTFVGEEPTTTAISSLSPSADAVEVARYNAAGQRVSRPVKGLNIIKLSNGKVIKHVVR